MARINENGILKKKNEKLVKWKTWFIFWVYQNKIDQVKLLFKQSSNWIHF